MCAGKVVQYAAWLTTQGPSTWTSWPFFPWAWNRQITWKEENEKSGRSAMRRL